MMSQEIEIEAKYILSRDSFHKIAHYFRCKEKDFFPQINHYFDTKEATLLRDHTTVLRVREKNSRYELTLKIPDNHQIVEINHLLPSFDFQTTSFSSYSDIVASLSSKNVNVNDLIYQGSLTTYRCHIPYLAGDLFLDINHYADTQDFEVEYEVTTSLEDAQMKLKALFLLLNIQDYQPSLSKARRLIEKKC